VAAYVNVYGASIVNGRQFEIFEALPFLWSNLCSWQADFSWPLDSDLFALLVGDGLAHFFGFVGTDFLGASGARLTWNDGTLLGRERMALLLMPDAAILLWVLLADLLVNADLLGDVIADLFVLIAALFPGNVLASLGRFVGANFMRDITANFLGLVDANSFVMDGGRWGKVVLFLLGKLFVNLGKLLINLGVKLLLLVFNLGKLLVKLFDNLLLD